ncbi:alpha/beta fold hydrolase [Allokutzneria oryzae]|uniref:Alpha/beta fold hydrolase n=1 Tax=Allokutzneria oryzae TaxID=1378989 RepID=A0ABV6A6Z8_9PSEU
MRATLATTLALLTRAGLTVVPAPALGTPGLNWRPCTEVATDWKKITGGDTRAECATLAVPLDHGYPDGKKTEIAVSRLKAADPARRKGVVLLNPGGPGPMSITWPLSVAKSGLAPLTEDFDLVGFDPRGTGYSDRVSCADDTDPQIPPTAAPKEKARTVFDHFTRYNERCAARDPEFTRQLTTTAVARDVDRIRIALGERKINYYGVSWGTAVGAVYRSLFDGNVERMWLDSVMPPGMNLAAMDGSVDAVREKRFAGFAPWLAERNARYRFGTTAAEVRQAVTDLRAELDRHPRAVGTGPMQLVLDGRWVAGQLGVPSQYWAESAADLAAVRDGGTPGAAAPAERANRPSFGLGSAPDHFNSLLNSAVLCNDGAGGRDFDRVWADAQRRRDRAPATGGQLNTNVLCGAWPWAVQQWPLKAGTSALQLSGHDDEDTTPYPWAVAMRNKIGGALLTIGDTLHGSAKNLPCAAEKVLTFFRTGTTTNGFCPGAQ